MYDALCSEHDALCRKRHYKEPWPEQQAVDRMRKGRGSHFDPDLFLANLDTLGKIREANPDQPPQEEDGA